MELPPNKKNFSLPQQYLYKERLKKEKREERKEELEPFVIVYKLSLLIQRKKRKRL